MASCFHQLPIDVFSSRVPGDLPSAEQRSKFVSTSVKGARKESDISPKLSSVINSVFDVAGVTHLRYLDTASHRAKDGDDEDTATYNDGGIYWVDSELARSATKLSSEKEKKKKGKGKKKEEKEAHAEDGAEHSVEAGVEANAETGSEDQRSHVRGRRSWHHVAVPSETKFKTNAAAFYFHERQKEPEQQQINVESAANKAPPPHDTRGERLSRRLGLCSHDVLDCFAAADDDFFAEGEVPELDLPELSAMSKDVAYYLRRSQEGAEGLGQLAEYMLNVFIYQHRIFSFFIYVLRNRCRLLHFERTGSYVSTPFDWTQNTSYLHDFVWKVAHMEKAQLGWDPTATLASDTERAQLEALITAKKVPPEIQEFVRKSTENLCPIYKLSITTVKNSLDGRFPDDPDPVPIDTVDPESVEETHEFIVGRPHFAAEALIGRCTKGYVALQLVPGGPGRLCYLKDCWRAHVPGRTRPEHIVYERLHKHRVPNIPTLLCGGDVRSPHFDETQPPRLQLTEVDQVLAIKEGQGRPVPRVHYRIATDGVGLPLRSFRSFRELALIIASAIRAHGHAWEHAKVLHRDISVGNILINPVTRLAILIDWDLSRLACELGVGPVEPDRSGTWVYRSALSLQYPRKPYRVSDDLESFIHIYRHLVLRYHATDTEDYKMEVKDTYEQAVPGKGDIMIGGKLKMAQLRISESLFEVYGNSDLQTVLDELARGCYSSYIRIKPREMRRRYGIQEECVTELPVQVDASWLEHVNSAGMGQTQHRAFPSDSIQASHATSTIPHLPSQTPTVPDPCEVQGYLASHDLVCATFEMYKEFPPRADKIADQFEVFRNNVLYEASTRRTLDYEDLSRSGVSLHMLHEWTRSQSRDHPGHAASSNSVSNNSPIPSRSPVRHTSSTPSVPGLSPSENSLVYVRLILLLSVISR
ncbi:hypothetical protein C8Q76DRAFT_832590 [Earliella scabrosa]|nr:hypothetical protein C8Q76DRAFT_832590 [Earliella scabrosa]